MSDLDLNDIYVDRNPWDELIKNNGKNPEKLLSSTGSLSNLSSSKSKISLKNSIKLNKDHSSDDNRVVTINEIVNIKMEELKVAKILEYQYVITKHLKNNLKNLNENREELLKKLNWLVESVKFLSEKFELGEAPQKKNVEKNVETNIIPRSSYKFCKYNYKCKYLYKDHCITNMCFEQHIVYNYLYLDISYLVEYINKNENSYNMEEIQTCINTIYFVVNHIKEELENLKTVVNCNFDTLKCIKKIIKEVKDVKDVKEVKDN